MIEREIEADMSSMLDERTAKRLHELCWQHARDAVYIVDLDTGILKDMDPAAETLSGYSREELVGQHFTLLHPEDERDRILDIFRAKSFLDKVIDGFHLRCKDAESIPVSIVAQPFESDGHRLAISIYWDITQIEAQKHLLWAQNWALSAYAQAALALGRAHSSKELLQALCAAVTNESAYVLAWVGIGEDNPDKRVRIAAIAGDGNARSFLDELKLRWSEDDPSRVSPACTCIRTHTPQVVEDFQATSIPPVWLKRAKHLGIHSSVSIPFSVQDGWHGALVIYSAHASTFTPAAITVFQNLAEQIAYGIHALDQERRLAAERQLHAKTEKQLVEALSSMVAPIIAATELRDPYTAGHQSRVAKLAYAIAKEMGWPENRLQGLKVAAMVHDIGKISIPAAFLTKPTRLSAAERAMINEHSENGYAILRNIPFPWPVAEIVRQHHEKLDGSGYPFGLKGDAILPEARVLAVADIVEAMSTFRPYRPAYDIETVLKDIESKAGRELDAEAVRVCASLFREKHFVLPHSDFC
jgi:PAS domain S-box-containing protein/putative nucleotidyltransferase with HDIG domain